MCWYTRIYRKHVLNKLQTYCDGKFHMVVHFYTPYDIGPWGNIRVRSPHGVPYIKQLPLREQQSVFSCDQAALWMVQSLCLSVCHTFLAMIPSSYHHEIFRSYFTNDRSGVHAKDQGPRSKVKVTEVIIQLICFRTVTPVWIHIWWWNDA